MKIFYILAALLLYCSALALVLGALVGILALFFYLVTHDFIGLGLLLLLGVIIALSLFYIKNDNKSKK